MDSQKWKESLARIDSMIVEMIDLLKNQSWLQLPASSHVVVANSPPSKLPIPKTAPTLKPVPKLKAPPSKKMKKLQPFRKDTIMIKWMDQRDIVGMAFDVGAHEEPTIRINKAIKVLDNVVFAKICERVSMLHVDGIIEGINSNLAKAYLKTKMSPVNEWRPPWYFAKTYTNVVGRLEWRPPWCTAKLVLVSSLRTRTFSTGVE
ncbi:hypothetical protein QVD17_41999 [Tagetes erecta]|uniref:Uncharacterized protein n=1 Tax=Tagetes erecta TaxID=13708 RepID=A0AAD8JMX3_TARER|nr:hypothetical protein QVD17_41999 [Tagetes erecta]